MRAGILKCLRSNLSKSFIMLCFIAFILMGCGGDGSDSSIDSEQNEKTSQNDDNNQIQPEAFENVTFDQATFQ